MIRAGVPLTKRFSRWGGGKLARALAPAQVRVYLVSDVIGDDLASIGTDLVSSKTVHESVYAAIAETIAV